MGSKAVCRPFVDLSHKLDATEIDFFSDAAKGEFLGLGVVCDKHWLFAQWEPGYIRNCNPSIEYLELLGVCMAFFAWCRELQNSRIVVHCNNQSVIAMINSTSASCKNCMFLIRQLTLKGLICNTRIFAKWVKGISNVKSDMLSRQKINGFRKMFPDHDEHPTVLPAELWPVSKIWIK